MHPFIPVSARGRQPRRRYAALAGVSTQAAARVTRSAATPILGTRLLTDPNDAVAEGDIGFVLSRPATLDSPGRPREGVSRLLALSGSLAVPCALIVTALDSRWSGFRTMALSTIMTRVGPWWFAAFAGRGDTPAILGEVTLP